MPVDARASATPPDVPASSRGRVIAIWLTMAVLLVLPWLLPAFAQPQDYHAFADRRGWLGIPNFGDVVSNVAFAWMGLLGLWTMRRPAVRQMPAALRHAYGAMFAGLVLTAFGSAYYHWAPSDARLVWDRLPITLVFMPLLAATLAERMRWRSDAALLAASALGIASVAYWKFSGNLAPYLVAQCGSILLLTLALCLLPSPWTGRGRLFAALAGYVIAFLCERADALVFAITDGAVSGHTLKHLAAAFAFAFMIGMLRNQRLRTPPAIATTTEFHT